ncbi:MAG TPA: hypothetical protein VGI66_00510 [Streptosporangiaceae bacterium]
MPIRRIRTPKPPGASPPSPPGNERAEIETMLRRLEELRRASRSNDLRGAYQVAINGLDGVAYRLTMLRALEAPKPVRRSDQRRSPTLPRRRHRAPRQPERWPPGSVQRASRAAERAMPRRVADTELPGRIGPAAGSATG